MTARYWFRPKRYGLGATPVTWEGWAFVTLMVAFVGGVTLHFFGSTRDPSLLMVLVWALLVGAALAVSVVVTKAKTQGEWRWRWGDPE
jgi:uncharacterized membrane protein YbhN (UPF0104 family)